MSTLLLSSFPYPSGPRRGAAGFTLVELMVAMVIGLLLTSGLLAIYVSTIRTNTEMAKSNRLIDNGRYAVQFLGNDIAHAGYWGGYVPTYDNLSTTDVPEDVPTAVPDPCLAYADWATDADLDGDGDADYRDNVLGIGLQAYESAPSSCSGVITSKQGDTDVLVVRHAETCLPGVGDCAASASGKLYFQTSYCSSDTAPYVLSDVSGALTLRPRSCTGTSEIRRFVSNIYYVRNYSNTAGDGIPTLVRSTFDLSGGTLAHQAATALIEGIEGFHVEFGVDSLSKTGAAVDYTEAVEWADPDVHDTPTNRGDGVPDGDYISCTDATPCSAGALTNVVTARIYVLARNRETSPGYTDSKTYSLGSKTMGPFNDGYKRHVFSSTVRLTNVSGRRDTP